MFCPCSVRRRPVQRVCLRGDRSQPCRQLGSPQRSRSSVPRLLHCADWSRKPGQHCEWVVILSPLLICLNSKSQCFLRVTEDSPNYILTFSPVSPDGHLTCQLDFERCVSCLQVLVPGGEKQVVLESLQPDTRYSILVTAEYRNREGGSGSAQGKTSE